MLVKPVSTLYFNDHAGDHCRQHPGGDAAAASEHQQIGPGTLVKGRVACKTRRALLLLLTLLTGGFSLLLCRWFPRLASAMTTRPSSLRSSTHLLITCTSRKTTCLVPLQTAVLNPDCVVSGFSFQGERFWWSPILLSFVESAEWASCHLPSSPPLLSGLTAEEISAKSMVFGKNSILLSDEDKGPRSFFSFLREELFSPFNVFQAFSVFLWCCENYYSYAGAIALIAAVSLTASARSAKQNYDSLHELSQRGAAPVTVLRDSVLGRVPFESLVPGDIIALEEGSVPADLLLLEGEAVLDESLITGEASPLLKSAPADPALFLNTSSNGLPQLFDRISRDEPGCILSAGTRVLLAKGGAPGPRPPLALCLRTGGHTTRGAMVRAMRYPPPTRLSFYSDSLKFVGVMALLALAGFLLSLAHFARMGSMGWWTLLVRALDLVTIVVPPALPASIAISTAFSLGRLLKKDILCIAPFKINVCGKVSRVVFDKTGTLTQDGLEVLGVHRIASISSGGGVSRIECLTGRLPPDCRLSMAMASCHSLRELQGTLVGDPLDLGLFAFSGWEMLQASGSIPSPRVASCVVQHPLDSSKTALGVVRSFEFLPLLRRSSVLVKAVHGFGMLAFVKGAPESILPLCVPRTVPQGLQALLEHYARGGHRVILLAGRTLSSLTWIRAQRFVREQVETSLELLGMAVFENKLRPDSLETVETLQRANLPVSMATGDHVLTAVSVARECALIPPGSSLFVSSLDAVAKEEKRICWESFSVGPLDDHSPTPAGTRLSTERLLLLPNVSLAITGDVFEALDSLVRENRSPETVKGLLKRAVVFARMAPENKQRLMVWYQRLFGDFVAFCGDGANDGGALQAADVGLSLAAPRGSGIVTVVAPFSTPVQSVRPIVPLLLEGRSSLATSFTCFRFMALYSMIQFMAVSLQYVYGHTLGDLQFNYQDLCLILPLAMCIARLQPSGQLSRKRPLSRLFSSRVLAGILGQIFIQSLFQGVVYCATRGQPWWEPPGAPLSGVSDHTPSILNTVLFCYSNFQYILVALLFCSNEPFQRSILLNMPLMGLVSLLSACNFVLLVFPSAAVLDCFSLVSLPPSFRMLVLAVALLNTVVSYLAETFFFPFAAAVARDTAVESPAKYADV